MILGQRSIQDQSKINPRSIQDPSDIGLSLHKLQVMGALRVAVAGAVFGAGRVQAAGLLGRRLAAVRVHLHEVDSTVEAAGHVEHVHRQSELSWEVKLELRWRYGMETGRGVTILDR